jgi:pyruvate,orthophosphate dikinase
LSRDDVLAFLADHTKSGILTTDPFVTLDRDGVGELIRLATERGRPTRATLKLGICGEHGGNPASIEFCEEVGLDYPNAPKKRPVYAPARQG